MRAQAHQRIGHLYPKATLPDGTTANVIAWIWARTVTCPNPACGIETPLVRSWWLGKKKGKEAYIVPHVTEALNHPHGKTVTFSIEHDMAGAPAKDNEGTVGRNGATCIACKSSIDLTYVRSEGRSGRLGSQLMSEVAEGTRSRIYLAPSDRSILAAQTPVPEDIPRQEIPPQAPSFRVQAYGMNHCADLFTAPQLTALTTFSDLVLEARERVFIDAGVAGLRDSEGLELGGSGADAYADAVTTYLGLAVSRTTDLMNSIVTWSSSRDQARNLFARQAIPMAWDFVEVSPFARAAGDLSISLESMARALVSAAFDRSFRTSCAGRCQFPEPGTDAYQHRPTLLRQHRLFRRTPRWLLHVRISTFRFCPVLLPPARSWPRSGSACGL